MPFRDIQGHRRVVDLLSRSIDRGTLPPSLVFVGGDTRAVSTAVAQALNCQNPVESRIPNPESRDACGVCPACMRIARGAHPDVLVIEPGENGSIKIDQVRAAIDRAGYRPFEGKRRVVIVDEAEALVTEAQNALLKTLEEPPASSVFMLLTRMPDLLLPTVRSRCVRLTFASGAEAAIDAEARDVAHRALVQAAGARDAVRRVDAAKELHPKTGDVGAAARGQVAAYLHAMSSLLRDAAVIATGASVPLANADAMPLVERLASAYGGERGVRAYAAVDRAIDALDRNAGAKVVADWVLLQL
jgi:DNA polymerase-3 subunit delta'